jgi:hypothetical protein
MGKCRKILAHFKSKEETKLSVLDQFFSRTCIPTYTRICIKRIDY